MVRPLSGNDAETLKLFRHRNKLLTAIREHSLCDPEEQSYSFIFQHCCDILTDAFQCNSVWAGDIDREECRLIHFASSPVASPNSSVQRCLATHLIEKFQSDPASLTGPLYLKLDDKPSGQAISTDSCCLVWPVQYRLSTYGFVAITCGRQVNIPGRAGSL